MPAGGMPPSHSGGGSNSGNGPNQAGEWTSQAPFQFDYQDTSYTCQSSSIQIVTNGEAREMQVRARLKQLGNPGDPYIIGQVLREYVGDRYEYNGQASVNQMIDYIKRGASLILQASVTEAGHVFPAVGCDDKADQLVKEFPGDELLHDGPKVIDPWTKYNWHKLVYDGTSMGYEGYYPWYGIYASAVKAYSFFQFQQVWGGKVPEGWKDEGGAYCHIIWPKK